MSRRRSVTTSLTTLWTSPLAPGEADVWAIARRPDVSAWLADLDAAKARAALTGRVLTQLECGEPVLITGGVGGSAGAGDQRWLEVVAPSQPSTLDARGYPGWVVAAHLGARVPPRLPATRASVAGGSADGEALVATARTHLGLGYLWGGMSHWGLDCSGLVHLSMRRLGVVVPRDAADQYAACEHIDATCARPGDLFFFAPPGRQAHHVGIVTGPARMLHAPGTGSVVVEEQLSPARAGTLVGAGRLPGLAPPSGGRR